MSQPKTFEEAVRAATLQVFAVLLERQRKHGSSSIDDLGDEGLYWLGRLKLARMRAKLSSDGWRASPEDDWIDLAGYAIIGLLRYRGEWGLPMREDEP